MSREHRQRPTERSRDPDLDRLVKQGGADKHDLTSYLQNTIGNAATSRLFAKLAKEDRGLGGDETASAEGEEEEMEARSISEPALSVSRQDGEEPAMTRARELHKVLGKGDDVVMPRAEAFAREVLGHKDGEEERSLGRDGDGNLSAPGDGGAAGTLANPPAFPNITTIKAAAPVVTAIEADWTASDSDFNERAAWVMWDSSTSTFSVVGKAMGTWASCTPTPKPADSGTNYHVGHYHIHPQLPPAEQPNTKNWPIKPSGADKSFATSNNSPGFVKDFNTTERKTGDTTYYDYGPSVRA